MIQRQASTRAESGEKIYQAIVAQARRAELYAEYGVPDTIDGRFDSILLHASLVIHFLAAGGESGQIKNQQLFDTMFRDFNHNLRQIGIGDMSIARHFRRMSEGFNGRLQAYAAAFDSQDNAALVDAIARNVFRDAAVTAPAQKLAEYVWRQFRHLAEQNIISGEFQFAGTG